MPRAILRHAVGFIRTHRVWGETADTSAGDQTRDMCARANYAGGDGGMHEMGGRYCEYRSGV